MSGRAPYGPVPELHCVPVTSLKPYSWTAGHAVVTTLDLRAVDVWRFYNSRAECENRIKELKEDFGAGGFSTIRSGRCEASNSMTP